jgi:hypothetical protein
MTGNTATAHTPTGRTPAMRPAGAATATPASVDSGGQGRVADPATVHSRLRPSEAAPDVRTRRSAGVSGVSTARRNEPLDSPPVPYAPPPLTALLVEEVGQPTWSQPRPGSPVAASIMSRPYPYVAHGATVTTCNDRCHRNDAQLCPRSRRTRCNAPCTTWLTLPGTLRKPHYPSSSTLTATHTAHAAGPPPRGAGTPLPEEQHPMSNYPCAPAVRHR